MVTRSALRAFDRHLWYLTQGGAVPKEVKQAIADRLLVVRPEKVIEKPCGRHGTGFGNLIYQSQLISPQLCLVLSTLIHGSSFTYCKKIMGFSQMLQAGLTLLLANTEALINDSAKQGVKLSADFLEAARSEGHYQNILQVVEKGRQQLPNLRKRKKKKQQNKTTKKN